MGFRVYCQTKGCNKEMEPYLDPKTDKVFCSECDNEITTITHFAKVQMKTLKQFKKKEPVSFSTKCQSCGKEDRPEISQDQKIICAKCKKEHTHLSAPFKKMLLDELKKVGKDI